MSLARKRLTLGITAVGTVVVFVVTALLLDLPVRWLGGYGGSLSSVLGGFAVVATAYVLLMLPFDLASRRIGPPGRRSARPAAGRFFGWARGVFAQGLIFVVSAALILLAGRRFGMVGAAGTFASLMALLAALQFRIGCFVGGLRRVERARSDGLERDVELVEADDDGFTGSVVGLSSNARVVVPRRWFSVLGGEGLAAIARRRELALRRGFRAQGLLVAFAWNLVGFVALGAWTGADVTTVAGLVTLFLWLNLWSFVGLLALPALSHLGVLAVDEAVREAEPEVVRTLDPLDALQGEEPSRPHMLERFFYPIPASARRIAAGRQPVTRKLGPWHVARTALYLSWAGFGLLARAVHCNCGRPQLWVMMPCD